MKTTAADFYRRMLRIRRFEEQVLDRFPRGLFYGTTHTYIGQEANAVGVLDWLQEGDIVVSNHRCHGHFLAYGGSMQGLAAELMGRSSGICGGRGGSQHLQWRNFYANGILGGTVPMAVGMAFALKARATDNIVFSFIGDGTLGEGVVYESLNMASLWGLPVLFILENNRYAQSTPIALNLAGDLVARFEAFGIPTELMDSTEVEQIRETGERWVSEVREGRGPRAFILETYRFAPHSKGDDVRDPEEIERHKLRDPLLLQAKKLKPAEVEAIEAGVMKEVQDIFDVAERAPFADPEAITPSLEHKA